MVNGSTLKRKTLNHSISIFTIVAINSVSISYFSDDKMAPLSFWYVDEMNLLMVEFKFSFFYASSEDVIEDSNYHTKLHKWISTKFHRVDIQNCKTFNSSNIAITFFSPIYFKDLRHCATSLHHKLRLTINPCKDFVIQLSRILPHITVAPSRNSLRRISLNQLKKSRVIPCTSKWGRILHDLDFCLSLYLAQEIVPLAKFQCLVEKLYKFFKHIRFICTILRRDYTYMNHKLKNLHQAELPQICHDFWEDYGNFINQVKVVYGHTIGFIRLYFFFHFNSTKLLDINNSYVVYFCSSNILFEKFSISSPTRWTRTYVIKDNYLPEILHKLRLN